MLSRRGLPSRLSPTQTESEEAAGVSALGEPQHLLDGHRAEEDASVRQRQSDLHEEESSPRRNPAEASAVGVGKGETGRRVAVSNPLLVHGQFSGGSSA